MSVWLIYAVNNGLIPRSEVETDTYPTLITFVESITKAASAAPTGGQPTSGQGSTIDHATLVAKQKKQADRLAGKPTIENEQELIEILKGAGIEDTKLLVNNTDKLQSMYSSGLVTAAGDSYEKASAWKYTDGAGNVSWVSPQNNKNITSNTLYSNNTALFFNNGALADLANVQTAIFPGAIAPVDGNIQVKLYVLCTTTNIPTGFSIIATDELGTDTVIPLTPATPATVSIGTNVSYSTDWSNWNADETKVYKLRIQGQGANISVGNIYLLTRAQ